ncbi:MAG: rubrerythrin family protein [Clostridium sp.]|nr:rubrerythrin family protein [Clostridium sp.]
MNQNAEAFAKSKTRENLLRAFAGESQARNRYTMTAGIAQRSGLEVIRAVFQFTADQEYAHARQFYRQLAPFSGENITIQGGYPIDLYGDLLAYLRAAQHNEYQEWEHDYVDFSRTAMEEGFPLVGKLFENVARVEKVHGDRFGRFADLLEDGRLFVAETSVEWMCLHCGYVVDASIAPAQCPVCEHPQGYFIRVDLSPFQGGRLR